VFSLVNNGGLSISAARGRHKQEVMSSFHSSTMVSYKSSIHVICLAGIIGNFILSFDFRLWLDGDFVH
jgi:hypothetical protein